MRRAPRPTRSDLLAILDRLQGLVGEALAANNDRNPNRQGATDGALRDAHDLCVLARSQDPPLSERALERSRAKFPIKPNWRT